MGPVGKSPISTICRLNHLLYQEQLCVCLCVLVPVCICVPAIKRLSVL